MEPEQSSEATFGPFDSYTELVAFVNRHAIANIPGLADDPEMSTTGGRG